ELDIGWVMGMGSVLGLFVRPMLGAWIDRVGARATWTLGVMLFAVCLPANLLVDDVGPFLYVLRSFTVVGAALFYTSSLTYVTHASPPDRKTEAIGILGTGGFLGMIIGPTLGDLFLGAGERTRQDFVGLFLLGGAAALASTVVIAFLKPLPKIERPADAGFARFFTDVRRHNPGSILVVCVVFGVCMAVPMIFIASYCDHIHVENVYPYFATYAGIGLAVRLMMRRVPTWLGTEANMLSLGMLLFAASMFCYPFAESPGAGGPAWLLVAAVVGGTAHALVFHTMIALSIKSFPPERRGTGSALALMNLDLGTVLGAPALGWIAHRDYGWAFAFVGVLSLGAAALCYRHGKSEETAKAEER
ncbi:MAG: MFS transporter, partial [Planctomycetia bacterium]